MWFETTELRLQISGAVATGISLVKVLVRLSLVNLTKAILNGHLVDGIGVNAWGVDAGKFARGLHSFTPSIPSKW